MNHTFVVLAFGESDYLEMCIQSVLNQTYHSKVVIATSTPNGFIQGLADKYQLSVVENPDGPKGIGYDFDFAVTVADTPYVTVAHQDDTYEPEFAAEVMKSVSEQTIIAFTDYHEQHDGVDVRSNTNLRIKRILLSPLKHPLLQKPKWVRRRVLSMGNPICCPSVTFHRGVIKENIFESDMKSNIDWLAWERLSKKTGSFVYVPRDLMMHRVHDEATTNQLIRGNMRTNEDYQMFCLFWPKWIATILTKIYRKSEDNIK